MKKTLLLILSIFLGMLTVNAKETFNRTFIGYYHYVDENGSWGDFELFKRTSDQRLAYCIEPGTPFNGGEQYDSFEIEENPNQFNISQELLEEISLWIHYGYGYKEHKQTSWYVATQYKIWSLLGRNANFTSENEPSNPWQHQIDVPEEIKEHIEEIQKLVTQHKNHPKIANQNIKVPLGGSITLQDNLLKEYSLQKEQENITLKEDALTIKAKEIANKEIILERKKDYWPYYQILYYNAKEQNLLTLGNTKKETIKFSYQTETGKIKITKLDAETKKCSQEFEGAIYGIYTSDNKLIKKLTIKNCGAFADQLAIGTYYIKELEAPIGYVLDTQKYPVTITEQNITKEHTLTVYEKRKEIPLKIIKYYQTESGNKLEENAEFDIIDTKTKKKVISLKTNESGEATTILPYGTYTIVQTKGKENYKFSESKNFILDDSTKNVTLTFVNEAYKKKVKVMKLEKNTKKKIKIKNIQFKIYDTLNKHYICENKDCIYATNDEGEFLTKELFPSTYTLEEVKQDFNNIQWNPEKIEFKIDKNSPEIIEIPFYNEKKLGEIKIKKTNEFHEALENIEFELYAKENIYDLDKSLIYKKDQKIALLKTNQNGEASKKDLPFGAYYLKETKTLENYYLDSTVYNIPINSSVTQNVNIQNKQIRKKVKVIKLEKNTKKKIKIKNIQFKIYDMINKHYICENKDCIYSTNDEGEFIADGLLPSTYILEEVKQDFENLHWNPEKTEFKIDKNSPEILEIPFYNEKKLGDIKLQKTDNFNTPLENVEFEIYAKDDILDVDNTVIYKKLTKIANIKTNHEGITSLENIPLGNYYIKEIKTQKDYQLNNTPFEIKVVAKKTTPETNTLNIVNYKIPKTKKNQNISWLIFLLGGLIIYDKKNKRFIHLHSNSLSC